jgi:O-antigen ligase
VIRLGRRNLVISSMWETTSVLTTLLFLIMLVPERLVIKPLGAAGRPGVMLAIACLLWWLNVTIVRGLGSQTKNQPARIMITPFCLSIVISYIVANSRPIVAEEVRSADRALLSLCAWVGVWMLTAEGVNSSNRLNTLLERMVKFGSVMGLFGVIQFLTGLDVTKWIVLPGLSGNSDLEELTRNGLNRPASTTAHPIEFGVIMAMMLPLALHQFQVADGKKQRRWAGIRLLVLAFATFASVSRSAILGIVIAAIMLLPNLPKKTRRQLYWASPLLLVAIKFAAPGLLGTILKLFTGIGSDDSAASRTGSFSAVASYIQGRPIFGRGFGTFLPSYHILDDQLLGALIEIGAVGLIALVALLLSGPVTAWRAAKRVRDPELRSLGIALSAAATVPATSFATFDALGFSTVAMLTFFAGGCCFAYARLSQLAQREEAIEAHSASTELVLRPQARTPMRPMPLERPRPQMPGPMPAPWESIVTPGGPAGGRPPTGARRPADPAHPNDG